MRKESSTSRKAGISADSSAALSGQSADLPDARKPYKATMGILFSMLVFDIYLLVR